MYAQRNIKPNNFLQKSSFLQEIVAEKQQILELKWIESEKVGFDIGYDKALCSWVRFHRLDWQKYRRAKIA